MELIYVIAMISKINIMSDYESLMIVFTLQ